VSLDGFLATVVLLSEGITFTVKDLVSGIANTIGGVHLGTPKTDKERELVRFSGLKYGRNICIYQLRAISRVTLKGIQELIALCREGLG